MASDRRSVTRTQDLISVTPKMVLASRRGFLLLCSTLGVLAFSIWRLWVSSIQISEKERASVLSQATPCASQIEQLLETSVSSTYALAALIQVDQLNVVQINFPDIAVQLLKTYKGITNLQLAPNAIVRQIVPISGNEGAIGHDLLGDLARKNDTIATILARRVIFVGPTPLKQGGQGIIARFPVFTSYTVPNEWQGPPHKNSTTYFWGFVTMLSLLDTFFEPIHLWGLEDSDLEFQIINLANGRIFRACSTCSLLDELQDCLRIPINYEAAGVQWVFLVKPKGGWPVLVTGFTLQLVLTILTTITGVWGSYQLTYMKEVLSFLAKKWEAGEASELGQRVYSIKGIKSKIVETDELARQTIVKIK